jgi:hypothetical protein
MAQRKKCNFLLHIHSSEITQQLLDNNRDKLYPVVQNNGYASKFLDFYHITDYPVKTGIRIKGSY